MFGDTVPVEVEAKVCASWERNNRPMPRKRMPTRKRAISSAGANRYRKAAPGKLDVILDSAKAG